VHADPKHWLGLQKNCTVAYAPTCWILAEVGGLVLSAAAGCLYGHHLHEAAALIQHGALLGSGGATRLLLILTVPLNNVNNQSINYPTTVVFLRFQFTGTVYIEIKTVLSPVTLNSVKKTRSERFRSVFVYFFIISQKVSILLSMLRKKTSKAVKDM
jgi:hypothetical protein